MSDALRALGSDCRVLEGHGDKEDVTAFPFPFLRRRQFKGETESGMYTHVFKGICIYGDNKSVMHLLR